MHGKETVWVLLLADALEENGQIMMVIELLDFNLPVDSVLGAVLDGDGKVSAVVEATELTGRNVAVVECAGNGLLRCWAVLGFVETNSLSSEAFTFLKSS